VQNSENVEGKRKIGRPKGAGNRGRVKRSTRLETRLREAHLVGGAIDGGMSVALTGHYSDVTLRAGLAAAGGLCPLVFLMGIMADPNYGADVRIGVAQSLLPYYHRRQAIMAEIDVTTHNTVAEQLELVYGIDEGLENGEIA
jgi:hypothetical protein